nr:unnamed protein product [Callosobruchus analis]
MLIIPGTGIISEYRMIVSKLPVVLLTPWGDMVLLWPIVIVGNEIIEEIDALAMDQLEENRKIYTCDLLDK